MNLLGLTLLSACLILTSCRSAEKPATSSKEPAPANIQSIDAFLLLPGDYAQYTSVEDLEARFGVANVRKEGGEEPRVVLFPEDPTRRAYVTFHDPATFDQLARIVVTDSNSRWRGKHGVHIGMSLAKVRELNGKPIIYTGFDSQKHGIIHDGWSPALEDDEKQPLGNFEVAEGDHLYFDLELGLADPSGTTSPSDLPVDERLSTDDPRFPKVGELVMVTAIASSSSLDDEW